MRYAGKVGLSEVVETAPGVWDDVITEVDVLGELTQRTESFVTAGSVIPVYRTVTSVSVLLGGAETPKYKGARYLTLEGDLYEISSIQHQYPRVTFFIGDLYSGPTPA